MEKREKRNRRQVLLIDLSMETAERAVGKSQGGAKMSGGAAATSKTGRERERWDGGLSWHRGRAWARSR